MGSDAIGPPVQQYVVLTFEFGPGDRAKLTLQGPKLPVVGVAPAIGVSRDANGNYHFLIGAGDHVYEPKDVPKELRKLFGDSGGGGGAPAQSIAMPTKDQLQFADGSFMTYQDYELNRKLWHSPGPGSLGPVWPVLPPALYQALIDFYSGRGQRPLPSLSEPGDYPLPTGDSRLA